MNNKEDKNKQIHEEQNSEDLDLLAFIQGLWKFKTSIILRSGIAFFLLLLIATIIYLFIPKFTTIKQPFSLVFSGIDKHQYPNGMHFSVNDIISTPVLKTVYKKYKLEDICDFQTFKSSFIIKQQNYKLNNLEKEYNAKLSDKKLLYTERKDIEEDFAKRRNAMKGNSYYLVYINKKILGSPIPKDIIPEILNDILKTWAEQAEKEKHVLNYKNKLLSPNSINESEIDKFDYLITADILKMYLSSTFDNLNYIKSPPGGDKVKIEDKTVNDYIFEMKKLQTFYLAQTLRAITTYAFYKDKNIVKIYIDSRLVDLERNKNELEKKKKLYDNSIINYTALSNGNIVNNTETDTENKNFLTQTTPITPQLGDSFFDSIISLAQKGNDTEFRQELTQKSIDIGKENIEAEKLIDFYKTSIDDIEHTKKIPVELKKKLSVKFKENFKYILTSIKKALIFANKAYEEISKQNLAPQSKLYDITGETLININASLSLKKFLILSILFWMLITGLIIVNTTLKYNLLATKK